MRKRTPKRGPAPPAGASPGTPVLSARRRRLYTAIVLLSALLSPALLEAGLRVAGYGHAYPLFVPLPDARGYLRVNPHLIHRYFADPREAPAVASETVFFRAPKAPGTLRVVVQGGSTAAGFPYGLGASLAGMLQQRLQHTFTDRPVEVISTAMTAVNSYTLLDLVDEIVRCQPDAVVIYAGHNEYVGLFGVASTVSVGTFRPLVLAYLGLRDLRVFQLLQTAYVAVRRRLSEEDGQAREARGTLMSRIAGETSIPYGSALYRTGVEQFRANLSAILARYQRAGVPVFVGTLVSNERDQKPFVSRLDPQTPAVQWEALYQAGLAALGRGDAAAAAQALDAAIRLDDRAADAHYARGRALELTGDYPAARLAYLSAKDRDQLRFRAPEEFNETIREISPRYGATVVDVQAAFLGRARDGIIGRELVLEHLHPNLEGYFLMADAFYAALRRQGIAGSWDHASTFEQAWGDAPITEVDRLVGQYRTEYLMSDWPFQPERKPYRPPEPTNLVEELAAGLYAKKLPWTRATERLLSHYIQQRDYREAARTASMLALAFPFLDQPQFVAGQLLVEAQRYREAVFYLGRAARLQPGSVEYLLALSRAAALDAQDGLARESLRQLLQIDPDHVEARRLLERREAPSGAAGP